MAKKSQKQKPIRVGVIGVGRGIGFAHGATDAVGMPATFYYQELDDPDLVFMDASFSF